MKPAFKKLIAATLVVAMAFSLVACGGGDDTDKPKPDPTPSQKIEVLDTGMLKQALSDDEAMAVAYLGYCEDDMGDVEDYLTAINMDMGDYSFMLEIDDDYRIDAGGYDLYCIVPKDEDATVTVSEWLIDEYNDWQGEEGNVLYHAKNDGNPVLVKCNESEIMPDVLITITDADGDVHRFVPYVSMMDGMLTNYLDDEAPVYDFSPYARFMPGWGDDWDNYDSVFDITYLEGDWSTDAYTDDNIYLDGTFTFSEDGSLYFAYGPSGEIYDVYYEGSYYMANDANLPENAVILELYLTENSTDSNPPESLYTAVSFEMYPYADTVGMHLEQGDMLFGNEYDTYYKLSFAVG